MDFTLLLALICYPTLVWGHARLMIPPSRSSMWRLGFPTKKNFNDNALYCGGISIQWQRNGGKCGICGDPYDMPSPRDNEAGGKYGRGIISKRYVSGQIIQATVDVTTNHRGYFEFKICPNNNPKKEATQECLDKYILKEAHGPGIRYYIGEKGNGDITVKLQLPKGLICSQCVFQWTYVAGNNWGKCEDGESRLGCGPQETFRGCADIAIHKNSSIFNVKPNENDVGSKHDVNSHKNKINFHPKGTTTAKPVVYTYEVTKQSRRKGNRTILGGNPNRSHHHDTDLRKFRGKNGDYIPRRYIPTSGKIPYHSDRRYHDVFDRRKYPKYDNRHFYFHNNNNMSLPEVSLGKELFVKNISWPFGIRQTYPNIGNRHIRKKHNAERSRQRLIQEQLSLMAHNDSKKDVSLAHGFNLGGRRYKDFWLL